MRFYNYIYEAREWRDKKFRKEAMEIYKQTYDWLKENQDDLDDILEDDTIRGEEVKILDFSDIQRDYKLLWIFRSIKVRDFTFVDGGELSTDPQIFLPIIEDSIKDIPENFKKYRKSILHELIHYLDSKRHSGEDPKSETPKEFNAYYQETIEDIRDDVKKGKLKINNFKEFLRTVKKDYFEGDFIRSLDKKYEKKLDKRLYELYKDIIKGG